MPTGAGRRTKGRQFVGEGSQLSGTQKQNCKVIGNENSFRIRIGMSKCAEQELGVFEGA